MEKNKGNRTEKGTFAKGKSGNPKGRPNTSSAKLRASLARDGEKVAAVVVQAALSGDMVAAKMVLDRILPPLKAQTEQVHIDAPLPQKVGEIAEVFTKSIADGSLPLEVGLCVLDSLKALPEIMKAADIEERRQKLLAERDRINELISFVMRHMV